MDKLSARSGEGDAALDRMMLADSLSALDQREREIIVLRFYYDQTQSQIAKRWGYLRYRYPDWRSGYSEK